MSAAGLLLLVVEVLPLLLDYEVVVPRYFNLTPVVVVCVYIVAPVVLPVHQAEPSILCATFIIENLNSVVFFMITL